MFIDGKCDDSTLLIPIDCAPKRILSSELRIFFVTSFENWIPVQFSDLSMVEISFAILSIRMKREDGRI